MNANALLLAAVVAVALLIAAAVAAGRARAREGLTTSTCPPGMRSRKTLPDGSVGTFCEMPGTGHLAVSGGIVPRSPADREGFAGYTPCGTILPNRAGDDDGPRASGVACDLGGAAGQTTLSCAASGLACLEAGGIPR